MNKYLDVNCARTFGGDHGLTISHVIWMVVKNDPV